MAFADRTNAPRFFNASLPFLPSPNDLVLALPRLAKRASSFALGYLPDQFDTFFSLARGPGSIIADATSRTSRQNNFTMIPSPSRTMAAAATTAPTSQASAAANSFFGAAGELFSWQNLSNLDGIFSYLASRWAIATLLIVSVSNFWLPR